MGSISQKLVTETQKNTGMWRKYSVQKKFWTFGLFFLGRYFQKYFKLEGKVVGKLTLLRKRMDRIGSSLLYNADKCLSFCISELRNSLSKLWWKRFHKRYVCPCFPRHHKAGKQFLQKQFLLLFSVLKASERSHMSVSSGLKFSLVFAFPLFLGLIKMMFLPSIAKQHEKNCGKLLILLSQMRILPVQARQDK